MCLHAALHRALLACGKAKQVIFFELPLCPYLHAALFNFACKVMPSKKVNVCHVKFQIIESKELMMAFLIGTQSYTFLSGFKNPWVCVFFPLGSNLCKSSRGCSLVVAKSCPFRWCLPVLMLLDLHRFPRLNFWLGLQNTNLFIKEAVMLNLEHWEGEKCVPTVTHPPAGVMCSRRGRLAVSFHAEVAAVSQT